MATDPEAFATMMRRSVRRAMGASVAACVAGLAATLAGWQAPARHLLLAALVLLLALPAVNVAIAAIVELRRRAWRFAAAALIVLALLLATLGSGWYFQ
jgi:hypothetical protein